MSSDLDAFAREIAAMRQDFHDLMNGSDPPTEEEAQTMRQAILESEQLLSGLKREADVALSPEYPILVPPTARHVSWAPPSPHSSPPPTYRYPLLTLKRSLSRSPKMSPAATYTHEASLMAQVAPASPSALSRQPSYSPSRPSRAPATHSPLAPPTHRQHDRPPRQHVHSPTQSRNAASIPTLALQHLRSRESPTALPTSPPPAPHTPPPTFRCNGDLSRETQGSHHQLQSHPALHSRAPLSQQPSHISPTPPTAHVPSNNRRDPLPSRTPQHASSGGFAVAYQSSTTTTTTAALSASPRMANPIVTVSAVDSVAAAPTNPSTHTHTTTATTTATAAAVQQAMESLTHTLRGTYFHRWGGGLDDPDVQAGRWEGSGEVHVHALGSKSSEEEERAVSVGERDKVQQQPAAHTATIGHTASIADGVDERGGGEVVGIAAWTVDDVALLPVERESGREVVGVGGRGRDVRDEGTSSGGGGGGSGRGARGTLAAPASSACAVATPTSTASSATPSPTTSSAEGSHHTQLHGHSTFTTTTLAQSSPSDAPHPLGSAHTQPPPASQHPPLIQGTHLSPIVAAAVKAMEDIGSSRAQEDSARGCTVAPHSRSWLPGASYEASLRVTLGESASIASAAGIVGGGEQLSGSTRHRPHSTRAASTVSGVECGPLHSDVLAAKALLAEYDAASVAADAAHRALMASTHALHSPRYDPAALRTPPPTTAPSPPTAIWATPTHSPLPPTHPTSLRESALCIASRALKPADRNASPLDFAVAVSLASLPSTAAASLDVAKVRTLSPRVGRRGRCGGPPPPRVASRKVARECLIDAPATPAECVVHRGVYEVGGCGPVIVCFDEGHAAAAIEGGIHDGVLRSSASRADKSRARHASSGGVRGGSSSRSLRPTQQEPLSETVAALRGAMGYSSMPSSSVSMPPPEPLSEAVANAVASSTLVRRCGEDATASAAIPFDAFVSLLVVKSGGPQHHLHPHLRSSGGGAPAWSPRTAQPSRSPARATLPTRNFATLQGSGSVVDAVGASPLGAKAVAAHRDTANVVHRTRRSQWGAHTPPLPSPAALPMSHFIRHRTAAPANGGNTSSRPPPAQGAVKPHTSTTHARNRGRSAARRASGRAAPPPVIHHATPLPPTSLRAALPRRPSVNLRAAKGGQADRPPSITRWVASNVQDE